MGSYHLVNYFVICHDYRDGNSGNMILYARYTLHFYKSVARRDVFFQCIVKYSEKGDMVYISCVHAG